MPQKKRCTAQWYRNFTAYNTMLFQIIKWKSTATTNGTKIRQQNAGKHKKRRDAAVPKTHDWRKELPGAAQLFQFLSTNFESRLEDQTLRSNGLVQPASVKGACLTSSFFLQAKKQKIYWKHAKIRIDKLCNFGCQAVQVLRLEQAAFCRTKLRNFWF